ncbi:uncharacterized protein LOC109265817 [Panthera pardus]|uniref:Uncharacterized protein LOC109265817 n=1 Tax=Panthera pardus TaxID=9691 RepID=A0A9W2VLS3_PANPR|nr:uncharacterized protein LOC109265817 [Panthera pardus]
MAVDDTALPVWPRLLQSTFPHVEFWMCGVKQALISIGSAPVVLAPFSRQTQNRPLRCSRTVGLGREGSQTRTPARGDPVLSTQWERSGYPVPIRLQRGWGSQGRGRGRGRGCLPPGAESFPREHVVWLPQFTAAGRRPGGGGVRAGGPGRLPRRLALPRSASAESRLAPVASSSLAESRTFVLPPAEAGGARASRGRGQAPLCPKELPSDLGSGGTSCFTSRNPSPAFSPSPSRVTSSCNEPADRMPQPGNPGLFLRKEEGPGLPEPLTDVCGKGLPHLPNRQLPFSFSRARDGRNRP